MSSDLTPERFLADVAEHETKVLHEDGLYRHVRFAKPGTGCMSFSLFTGPGCLLFTGDMGTYVFSRVPDMFTFFRSASGEDRINPSYWSEKVLAADRSDGIREFSEPKFWRVVKEHFDEWADGRDLPKKERSSVWSDIESEVRDAFGSYGKEGAYRALLELEHEKSLPFQDFWEVDTDEYTYRYLWCCHALVWGIGEYDAFVAGVAS